MKRFETVKKYRKMSKLLVSDINMSKLLVSDINMSKLLVSDINTVDSRYLEIEGTLKNSSRYPYFDISDL